MSSVNLTWLGQSGFLLHSSAGEFACDLYLSDYCKKRSKLDHTRLTPIPVAPDKLPMIDHYLITHSHIDHFDPETVGPLMDANQEVKFYCPPSGKAVIDEFFASGADRFIVLNSMVENRIAPGVRLFAVPAAHEELERDESGEYIAFSYLLILDNERKCVFFAGDTIPFVGQGDMIKNNTPQGYDLIMVLPVNGRDERRATLGFKGNLTLEEAATLAGICDAKTLVPCHVGMFALNDIDKPLKMESFERLSCSAVLPEVNKPFSV